MKKASICLRVIAIAAACAGAAHAGAFDTIYDDQDSASLRPRYERGWHDTTDGNRALQRRVRQFQRESLHASVQRV